MARKAKTKLKIDEKENKKIDANLKLIAKSSIVIFISIFLSKVIAYFYRIVIARNFNPEVYGRFSIALMLSSFFIYLGSLGLLAGLSRYIPFYRGKKDFDKIRHITKFTTITLLLTGIICAFILFYFSDFISINFFHDTGLSIFIKWFGLMLPFSIFMGMFVGILQAFEDYKWPSFIRNIQDNLVRLLVLIILVFLGFKTSAIIASYVVGILSAFVVSYYVCRKNYSQAFGPFKLSPSLKSELTKELFSYSWPLMFLGIVFILFSWIDSFTIGYLNVGGNGIYNVGIYNAAVPIAVLISIAPSLFIQLFFPLITKEFAKNNIRIIKETSKQIGKWIFILNLPIFLIIFLFPGAMINFFFGKEYLAAEQALRFLSIGMFFFSIFTVSDNLLSMAGKSKAVLFNMTIAALLNLVLNFIFIPSKIVILGLSLGGINGAAFATMISYTFWSILTMFQANHYVSVIPVRRKMLNIFLISLIPTLLLLFIKKLVPINSLTLVLLGSMFFLLYAFLIIITKSLDKNDLAILSAIKNKIVRR